MSPEKNKVPELVCLLILEPSTVKVTFEIDCELCSDKKVINLCFMSIKFKHKFYHPNHLILKAFFNLIYCLLNLFEVFFNISTIMNHLQK